MDFPGRLRQRRLRRESARQVHSIQRPMMKKTTKMNKTEKGKMFKSLTKKKQSDDAVEDEGKESDDDGKHDEPDSIAEEDGEDGEEEEEDDA